MESRRGIVSGFLSVITFATTKIVDSSQGFETLTRDHQYTINAIGVLIASIAGLFAIIQSAPGVYRKFKTATAWITWRTAKPILITLAAIVFIFLASLFLLHLLVSRVQ